MSAPWHRDARGDSWPAGASIHAPPPGRGEESPSGRPPGESVRRLRATGSAPGRQRLTRLGSPGRQDRGRGPSHSPAAAESATRAGPVRPTTPSPQRHGAAARSSWCRPAHDRWPRPLGGRWQSRRPADCPPPAAQPPRKADTATHVGRRTHPRDCQQASPALSSSATSWSCNRKRHRHRNSLQPRFSSSATTRRTASSCDRAATSVASGVWTTSISSSPIVTTR